MSDFLDYVERNYGCVAEYNRSRFEDEEHEAELQYKANESYKANKAKLDQAEKDGSLVWFSDSCYEDKCPSYTDIGMSNSEDDITHGICGNLDCKDCAYRKHEAQWKAECAKREEERKATIKRAYTDTRTRENNKVLVQMLSERADYLNRDTAFGYDRLRTLVNMYIESEDDANARLKIIETVSLLLGLSIEEIAQKMLGEYDDTIFGGQ